MSESGNSEAATESNVQFVAAWDECGESSQPNWQIKGLEFNPLVERAATLASFSVQYQASSSAPSAPPVFLQWQIDRGDGFADIPGATKADLNFVPRFTDNGAKVRCLLAMPGLKEIVTTQPAVLSYQEIALALQVIRSGNGLQLSWPADPNFVLEQAAELASPPALTKWTAVSDVPVATAGTNRVNIAPTQPQSFFRLRK